jgi:hypothetical protein
MRERIRARRRWTLAPRPLSVPWVNCIDPGGSEVRVVPLVSETERAHTCGLLSRVLSAICLGNRGNDHLPRNLNSSGGDSLLRKRQ